MSKSIQTWVLLDSFLEMILVTNFKLIFVCFLLGACAGQVLPIEDNQKTPRPNHSNQDQMRLPAQDDQILNFSNLLNQFHVKQAQNLGFYGQGVKVAIFDNGFAGLPSKLGKTLPAQVTYIKNSNNKPAPTDHGTKMAELVYMIATGRQKSSEAAAGPELFLFNCNGFSNLQDSIQGAIDRNIDIILYSQVWEYGGNFDGKGFINAAVNKATSAGITWINASGNYGDSVWSGSVQQDLRDSTKEITFIAEQNDTKIKIVVTWNNFTDDPNFATKQDLDFDLIGPAGEILETANKKQAGKSASGSAPNATNWSGHAREIVKTVIDAGTYIIRVKKNSRNFDSNSKFKVTVEGNRIRVNNANLANSVLIPADNPSVITIGASDYKETSQSRSKPEVWSPSLVAMTNGDVFQGTSTAAAMAAGSLAVSFSQGRPVNRGSSIRWLNQSIP